MRGGCALDFRLLVPVSSIRRRSLLARKRGETGQRYERCPVAEHHFLNCQTTQDEAGTSMLAPSIQRFAGAHKSGDANLK